MKKDENDKLNWNDPAACRTWLLDLQSAMTDLRAAAEDQVAPIATRDLGRARAKQLISDSATNFEDKIAYALRGLPEPEPKEVE